MVEVELILNSCLGLQLMIIIIYLNLSTIKVYFPLRCGGVEA